MKTRVCDTCKKRKKVREFVKATTKRAKYKRHCKACYKNKTDKWRKARGMSHFRKTNRKYHLKNQYGIDHTEYLKMLKAQNGSCAICDRKTPGKGYRNFQIDHNHKTGQNRGLLCCYCNRGIGQFREKLDVLYKAIDYLIKYNGSK